MSDRAPFVDLPGAGARLFQGDRGIVPYVAMWGAEEVIDSPVVGTALGIGYADEVFTDRDRQGLLWSRVSSRPGYGTARYGLLHPLRQRRAMRKLLCQVCAAPADRDERGALWLAGDQRALHADWPGWPNKVHSSQPPVCLRCARIALRACPWLREKPVAVRAHSRVVGATGACYLPGRGGLRLIDPTAFADYTDPIHRWVQADQLLREWINPTIVTL